MILPEMSEATSTLVCGRTWPLAVTDAVRSRRSTGSIFTSTALVPFFMAAALRMPMTRSVPTPKPINFVFLFIVVPWRIDMGCANVPHAVSTAKGWRVLPVLRSRRTAVSAVDWWIGGLVG